MPLLPYQLRRGKKLITAWIFILVFSAWAALRRYCSSGEGSLVCEQTVYYIFVVWKPTIIGIIVLLLLNLFRHEEADVDLDIKETEFSKQPWKYDKAYISLQGQIEHIFEDSFGEVIRRKFVDIYRNFTKNNDRTNRYIHQRFLLASYDLKDGEKLMVHHNTRYGVANIKEGNWVEVQGEYVHKSTTRREGSGRVNNYYGLLHRTYEPRGYINLLNNNEVKPNTLKVIQKARNPENLRNLFQKRLNKVK